MPLHSPGPGREVFGFACPPTSFATGCWFSVRISSSPGANWRMRSCSLACASSTEMVVDMGTPPLVEQDPRPLTAGLLEPAKPSYDHGFKETCGQAEWHGRETMPQQLLLSWRLPIFKQQCRHAGELGLVVRYERAAVGQGDGGNLQIIGADRGAERFQVRADCHEGIDRGVVEREARIGGEQGIDGRPIGSRFRTAGATIPQLGHDHRTDAQVGARCCPEPCGDLRFGSSEQRHPDVGVEEVSHSTSTGGGRGGCGWTMNVSSSMEPSRSK